MRPIHCNCAASGTTKSASRLIEANNKQFGIVELKFSSVCKTAWAKMTLDKAVASGSEADAYVKRNTDGKELSCSSAGGNVKVLQGQTSCYTPMVYGLDPRSSYAMGNIITHQPEPSFMPIQVRIKIKAAVYESTLQQGCFLLSYQSRFHIS
ncbi:DUF2690 domain-containing protein [Bacillus haynesii]|nr:DUF2690 domain-containing protein [Bacillus haynesii]MCY7777819.1 YjfA family protein [Bacillus haynesii]MEC0671092.1 DUF2690 domain-containing protein [Bacillus haynesii]MEC1418886.1 DUF2690 domain-containing protein [Bacillus haynesii]MEC1468440.1 DUF2690 domain-containing protein [Bacillus haynesii]